MNVKMTLEKQIIDDEARIFISGNIDEDSDFSEIMELGVKKYVFDFAKVTMLNSCGIREWILLIDKLGENANIRYKNCPQIVIEQMGMVYGFIKKEARIESFYAPYFCSDCDEEQKILLEAKDIKDQKAPSVNCKKCGMEMEFDEIEEQYFSFMKNMEW
ncbi:MAG: hypothetical protein KAQ98_10295 [Bacteriovoracaceae bacterium]|nr:hypothetical protein [Bacteriovoracaceae bacterium]